MFSLFPLSLLDLKNAYPIDRGERSITQQFLWLRFYADIFNRVFYNRRQSWHRKFWKGLIVMPAHFDRDNIMNPSTPGLIFRFVFLNAALT